MAQKVISKFGAFLLILIGFVLLTFGLKQCGVDTIKTTEDSEMIDRPHAD